ncbi:MAG: exodeoxyribonuclease III [Actinobacteria bacterium]|nr:exodeoxyribonuclease III [Actinomycetota bacterium]
MKLATWNVNSLNARMPRVVQWIEEMEPDVLCLQETKLADDAFPHLEFRALGYDTVHHGQGQWNGVAILSRVGLDDPVAGFDDGGPPDRDARLVWATCGGLRVASMYVPNGRELTDDHYTYKLGWLDRLAVLLEGRTPGRSHALCGDFNIAPGDDDVWDLAAFVDSTHVSAPERAAFDRLVGLGFRDVLRTRHPDAGLYTYWDYRGGAFHKRQGMRIDHVLVDGAAADTVSFVFVDRNARKGDKPSDHTVLMVEVEPA